MKILCIADCLKVLPTIVEWERGEWGDAWSEIVRRSTERDRVPTIYVALEGDKPLGCAMLVEFDMMTRHDLTPWLGGIFVHPDFRRCGVASALIRHAMDKAAQTGIRSWWLYTESARNLYKRFGWQDVVIAHYDGAPVTIMRYDFPALPPVSADHASDSQASLR